MRLIYTMEVFMKRYIKNPFAEHLKRHGCKVQITSGEGENEKVVEEYFVTPQEIMDDNKRRAEFLRNRQVHG